MFGFVRPAACRSSAPRSVTDGCPYPPLPRRAKKQKQDSTVFSQKTGNQRKWWGLLHPLQELLPPPAGGPPPSRREVWGASRAFSKPFIQLRVQGRNPARFKGGYGVPRGFKGEKSKSPPNPLGLAERVPRPWAVEGVSRRWKAFAVGGNRIEFPKSKFMRQNAEPCAGLRRILTLFHI